MQSLRLPPSDQSGDIVRTRFKEFLQNFQLDTNEEVLTVQQRLVTNYIFQIKKMIETDNSTAFVNFAHLQEFDCELAEAIEMEYYRFDAFLRIAVRDVVEGLGYNAYIIDVDKGQREFFVAFYNMPRCDRVRSLKTDRIGRLVSVMGTVTRTSEVRPELLSASYTCSKCGTLHTSIEQQFQYTEPQICRHPSCKSNAFQLLVDQCVFVDWQRLRVQENADEIPPGSMPRCMDIICRNASVESAKAGDKVIFTGMVAVIPDTGGLSRAGEATVGGRAEAGGRGDNDSGVQGLKSLGCREMTYKMVFLACSIQHPESNGSNNGSGGSNNIVANCFFSKAIADKNNRAEGVGQDEEGGESTADILLDLTDAQKLEISTMRNSPNLYKRMVDSICPTVFGHSEVKRGVLLMLFGGVHKKTAEGTMLRGDINVCIVGDPSCAKSQFLKYVHGFLPRCIYTSGKSSSAAGLTASVIKDAETGEFCVEAGALMLADNGICCIDEFDKMDDSDQVAIHEAMEQQTISITKAGIVATLNARTSILAAANPVFGRYDSTKPLKANVIISAPIMSRFDLFFVILDECDPVMDEHIARHIVAVHRDSERKRLLDTDVPFSQQQLQRYIRFAKCINPQLTPESRRVLVDSYRILRSSDSVGKNKTAYRITVRQLESLIRLSEALARLHLDSVIQVAYVREALRLLQKSIIHVESEDIELEENEESMNLISQINAGAAGFHNHMDQDAAIDAAATAEQIAHEHEQPPEVGAGSKRARESLMASPSPSKRPAAAPEDADAPTAPHAAQGPGAPAAAPKEKKKEKAKISADEYARLTTMILLHLKRQEMLMASERPEEDDSAETDLALRGTRRADVIAWYLEEHIDELDSTELFDQKKRLLQQVIRRMLKSDGTLIEIGEYEDGTAADDRYVRRHPSLE